MKKLGSGQAMVMVLLVSVVLTIVTTLAVSMVMSSTLNTSMEELGGQALLAAESGAEEAILRLLRDPAYAGGNLTTPTGDATVVVSAEPTMIVSTGTAGGYERVVEVVVGTEEGKLVIESWRER